MERATGLTIVLISFKTPVRSVQSRAKDNTDISNAAIAVRSVGERTTQSCEALLRQQMPDMALSVINVSPFTEAIRQSFQYGIDNDVDWLFVIDADILPFEDMFRVLLKKVATMPDNVFSFQPLVLDKLTCARRHAGVHIYRGELLPQALDHIPEDGVSLRPETYVKNRMAEDGYPTQKSFDKRLCAGLHDFCQYRADLYRKAYLQAYKHQKWRNFFKMAWVQLAPYDTDYKALLKGFEDGESSHRKLTISKDDLSFDIKAYLYQYGLEDKQPLLSPLTGAEVGGLRTAFETQIATHKDLARMVSSLERPNVVKKLLRKLLPLRLRIERKD